MKKLRSKHGFTLTEMLIAVLLLALVSLMVTVMTSTILTTTASMQEVAQAEILGNEAFDNLRRNFRFGSNFQTVTVGDKSTVKFNHDDANTDYTYLLQDGMIVEAKLTETAGKYSIAKKVDDEGNETDDDDITLLFAGVSYGQNLIIKDLTLELVGDAVEITLGIYYGEKNIWEGSISVTPLNKVGPIAA